jgi:phage terminase large subunit-like protein
MINKKDYAEEQIRRANEFVNGVLDGSIVSNKYVRLAVERYQKDLEREDLYFDLDKVRRVFSFFALLRINIENDYKQFQLLPFQAFVILNIYGFYWRRNGKRRFRYSYIEMARKGGKTTFSAALSLYHLVADGELDAQALFLASTREQAGIALRYVKSITANSPALQRRLNVRQYDLEFKNDFNGRQSVSILKPLASVADRLDGYSPSYVLIDEYHSHPTDEIFKVMKSGIGARKNPMISIITTAGFDLSKPCYNYREGVINILKGEIEDDSLFGIIFTLNENDDYSEPSNWIKANPALGQIQTLEDMVIEFNQAKITPSLLNNFLTKNLNLWISNEDTWIPDEDLKEAFSHKMDIEDFKGEDCYIGVDLSSTRDLTSFVLLFKREDKYYAFPKFFMANNPKKKIRKGGIDLGLWIRQGLIIECSRKTIDYDLMFEHFENWAKDFRIISVGYDPYNSDLIIPRIEAIGIECTKVPQTAPAFNFPLKYMEKEIYDNNIRLDNKVLRWNFQNVVLYVDGNENIKIMKNKSKDSVDGVVALGMAFGMWLKVNFDPQRVALEAYIRRNKTE